MAGVRPHPEPLRRRGGGGQATGRAPAGSGEPGPGTPARCRRTRAPLSVPAALRAADRDGHLASRQRLARQSWKTWPGCGEGAGGLGAGGWRPPGAPISSRGPSGKGRPPGFTLCNYQTLAAFQVCVLPPLPPAPGFPSDPEQAGNTRKGSSSSYNINAPAPPSLAGKTKPQPLWGPEGRLCEVNPVLPPLFHSGNQLLVRGDPSLGVV